MPIAIEPALVSEHLCWSGVRGRHFRSYCCLCRTPRRRSRTCRARVEAIQEALGRKLAVENVSTYLAFADATIPEWEFVAELARRSGCDLLVDVNNIHVNSVNHGFDAEALSRRDPARVPSPRSIWRASTRPVPCLIDTHGAARRAGRLGALHARDRALRPAADADRMGPRHSRIRGARRARPRRPQSILDAHHARRSLSCSSASPEACTRPKARRRNSMSPEPPRPPSGWTSTGARCVRTTARRWARPIPVVRRARRRIGVRAMPSTPSFARTRRRAAISTTTATRSATFLAQHPSTAALPYLPDVARLEWAIDEVNRAADGATDPSSVLEALAAVAPERLPGLTLRLAPRCRLDRIALPDPADLADEPAWMRQRCSRAGGRAGRQPLRPPRPGWHRDRAPRRPAISRGSPRSAKVRRSPPPSTPHGARTRPSTSAGRCTHRSATARSRRLATIVARPWSRTRPRCRVDVSSGPAPRLTADDRSRLESSEP